LVHHPVDEVEGEHSIEAALKHGQQALHHSLVHGMGKVGVAGGGISKSHREAVCEPLGQSLAGVVRATMEAGNAWNALAKTAQLLKDRLDGTLC